MYLFAVPVAIIGWITGIFLAVRAKKVNSVVYGKLDIAGRITNILLIPVDIALTLFVIALSFFANPEYDGFLGILGWIVAVLMGSVALFCGLGLGFSVALRKKGKSRLSFAVQFAGVIGIAINLILFFVFYGNLLSPLN
jgi:hypothetical protein